MSTFVQDKSITLGQCLHGYMDGHRLLETSRQLSAEAEKQMQMMSDLSGPTMIPGFETYLTGYPVPDLGVYALGRTWYAPEMKRPGCVWTHTLLIENSDLAQISDLRVLLEMFERPSKERASWGGYASSLVLRSRGMDVGEIEDAQGPRAEVILTQVLVALYGLPDRPVYIPGESAKDFEDLIFRIWNQQWPRLRRSFTFSTGSIAYRKRTGKPFDLQVVSVKSVNRLGREVPSAVNAFANSVNDSSGSGVWILAVTGDLKSGTGGELRRFFQQYGVDTNGGRQAFAALAFIYAYVKDSHHQFSVEQCIEVVAGGFPEASEASRLKMSLFGSDSFSGDLIRGRGSEADLLRNLAKTRFYGAFDPVELEIGQRARRLLEKDRDNARSITLELFGSELTPLGEEFMTGIAEAINVEDAYEFAQSNLELLNAFTKYNPALAAMPGLWLFSADEQRDFFDVVVADPRTTDIAISEMIVAMLEAGSDVLAEEVINKHRKLAVRTILDWVDRSEKPSCSPGLEWQRSLRLEPSEVLGWLRRRKGVKEQTVAFIISLLDPHSAVVVDSGANLWIRFSKKSKEVLPYHTLVRSMAFLLALGFNNAPSGASLLVVSSFEIIHAAAAEDDLPNNCWRILKDQAPDHSSWWSWDKCKRLRRALVDKFIEYEWAPGDFLKALENEKTFKSVVDDSFSTRRGTVFIKAIAERVVQDEVEATSYQRKVLVRIIS